MSSNADAIQENAQQPRRASGDGVSAEQHSIPDQIAAAKFAASSGATKRKNFGLRLMRSKKPSALGD